VCVRVRADRVSGGRVCSAVFACGCSTCKENRIDGSSEFSRNKGHLVSTEICIALLSFVY
jgi:hypothetical protein